jgi:hypothetical protein
LLGTFSVEKLVERPFLFLLLKYHNATNPSIIAITPIVTPAPIPPAAALLNPDDDPLEDGVAELEEGDVEVVDAFPDPVQKIKLELQRLHHDPSDEMLILDIADDHSLHGISVEL